MRGAVLTTIGGGYRPVILASMALLAVLLVAFVVATQINRVSEKEKNLHAVICAASALTAYVASKHSWPRSWDELSSDAPPSSGSMFRLPDDIKEIRSRVKIRFHASPNELRNPQNANLLESNGESYEYQRYLLPMYSELQRYK
jgi:hypothetical protein